jgi:perosamine synthetase
MVHEKEGTFANYTYPSIWLSDDIPLTNTYIISELKKRNIHPRPGFPPMSLFPMYKKDKRFVNSVAYKFWKRGIVLPAAHNLNQDDINFVCDSLDSIIEGR